MSTHLIRVHEVQQGAGGGSYVCIFDAQVVLGEGETTRVTVSGVEPPDASAELVALAAGWIRASAAELLDAANTQASIAVTRLVLNSTDLKETRFKQYTALEFRRLLAR